ncbi:MAG: CarD family transcriptional regulator [Alphaproteobacteria bacterium]|nr:CarD family transcriptional regulator [Alphaproteobacteria bacterium]
MTKKSVTKKSVTKKSVTKKPVTKKPAAPKKAVVKGATKRVVKKASAKKATPAKKQVAKKVVKKAPAKKTPIKKVVKKAPPKKTQKKSGKKSTASSPAPERRQALGFRVNEYIVYPAHGVGQVIGISIQKIADMELDLFVIHFDKEKMTLRVPVEKAKDIGMRKLADNVTMSNAMKTLRGRARIKRTMWSRRAQEYEAKINSGDLIAVSEVVRDLFRNEHQPEQSYSERQLYEAALERMAREVAMIDKKTEEEASIALEVVLAKTTGGVRRLPNMAEGG